MKLLIISTILFSGIALSKISLNELDFVSSFSNSNSYSMIESGIRHCNEYFNSNKLASSATNYENSFFCKFSKKRNRFYIYMLSQHNDKGISIKNFCENLIRNKEEIYDHLDKSLLFQDQNYLKGFYIENIFNDSIVSFTNNFQQDELVINNEINKYILKKRSDFSLDNEKNNLLLEKEILKLKRIYKKTIDKETSDLERLTKAELNKITRYKVFINDINNFKSYSCTWSPGKGIKPYVKLERFSEFENI